MYTLLTSIKGTISRKQFFLFTLFRLLVATIAIIIGFINIPEAASYMIGAFFAYLIRPTGIAVSIFIVGMIPSVIKRLRDSGHNTNRTWLRASAVIVPWIGVVGIYVDQFNVLKILSAWQLILILLFIILCMEIYLLLKAGKKTTK